MTNELILVVTSGMVGFVMGAAMMLLLRDRPGTRRNWESESGGPYSGSVSAEHAQTDKREATKQRGSGYTSATGGEAVVAMATTSRSSIPVAMLTLQTTERGRPKSWLLRQASTTTIGRFDDCDIAVDDNDVSRLHAQITHRTDAATAHEFTIFDYSSTNGTMINDQPISAVASLQDGDVIRIGNSSLMFRRIRKSDL